MMQLLRENKRLAAENAAAVAAAQASSRRQTANAQTGLPPHWVHMEPDQLVKLIELPLTPVDGTHLLNQASLYDHCRRHCGLTGAQLRDADEEAGKALVGAGFSPEASAQAVAAARRAGDVLGIGELVWRALMEGSLQRPAAHLRTDMTQAQKRKEARGFAAQQVRLEIVALSVLPQRGVAYTCDEPVTF
eukprot:scaffold2552_cov380-Prasinococcus_capsulatus_cf.AAC.44